MLIIFYVLVGVVGRLVIHIPDVTPITSLCLLAPTVFSKRYSFLLVLIILLLSDFCLHVLFHYPIFGSWTLFTYSGWIGIVFIGILFSKKASMLRALHYTLFSSLLFWIWTNFGTWMTTDMYAHNAHGLVNCYIAALPFLRNSVLGSCGWTGVLWFLVFHGAMRRDKSTSLQLTL